MSGQTDKMIQAIAKNFALARTTINQPLWTFPMHLRLLANMEIKFRGMSQNPLSNKALQN